MTADTMSLEEFKNSEEGKQPVEDESQFTETDATETDTPVEVPPTEEPAHEDVPSEKTNEPEDEPDVHSETKGLENELAKLETKRDELKAKVIQRRSEVRNLKKEAGEDQRQVTEPTGATGDGVGSEPYQDTADYMIEQFLEEHPEYKEENDPLDEKWNTLKAEFDSYKLPKNPYHISKLLLKAHKVLSPSTPAHAANPARANAQKEKLRMAGQGGGGSKATATKSKTFNQSTYEYYKRGGFSDAEAKEMATK